MGFDAGSQGNSRRLRNLAAAGGITGVLTAGLLATGGIGYAANGVKNAAGGSAAGTQYGDTRPGWGCGDKNHVHTGPPGRQYASRPPGCTK